MDIENIKIQVKEASILLTTILTKIIIVNIKSECIKIIKISKYKLAVQYFCILNFKTTNIKI